MSIAENLSLIKKTITTDASLVAVSKTKPIKAIQEAYTAGQRIFGENRPQEMKEKAEQLPKDIQWHMIGHLQSNKVKYIASFVKLIHSVDKLSLLEEINKRAAQHQRKIDVLLQLFIAQEESKFGLDEQEVTDLLKSDRYRQLENIRVVGLMGMATNTSDQNMIRKEFKHLKKVFDQLKKDFFASETSFCHISMGMSGDYPIALEEGSTLIRVGSAIFGERN